ncbi:hypothetical protein ACN9OS_05310 [Glaesserella parasuis]|uniref:hypothetical protein n=1 Tax=Glaesserella parasuis TaxID=738 RepID=UPI002436A238|nr:hypothetical protein [Glaesserella parasuis]MDG6831995.1 hypothetical protein [Glaesserella parasuis]
MNNETLAKALEYTTQEERNKFHLIQAFLGQNKAPTANQIIKLHFGDAITAYYNVLLHQSPDFKKFIISKGL